MAAQSARLLIKFASVLGALAFTVSPAFGALCVRVIPNGNDAGLIEQTADIFPACSEFALMTPVEYGKLTYWVDLAIELDPAGAIFPVLVTAMFTSVGIVLGARMVWDNLRAVTKEA